MAVSRAKRPLVVPLDRHKVNLAVEGDTLHAAAVFHAGVQEIRLEGDRTSLFNFWADLTRNLANLPPPPHAASDEQIAPYLGRESGTPS